MSMDANVATDVNAVDANVSTDATTNNAL